MEYLRPFWAPAVLKSARAIASYVENISPDEVDTERVEECFRGAAAYMCWMDVSDLGSGPADSHRRVPKRQRLYCGMPASSRPPILVQGGSVEDGHHRLRDAVARGEKRILAYEVVDEDEIELHRQQAEQVEFAWWTSDTQVLDESGQALAVFHGTCFEFDEFDSNPRGIFFSQDRQKALSYCGVHARKPGAAVPRLIEARLRIRNPWNYVSYGLDVPYRDQLDQSCPALMKKGYDGLFMPEEGVWVAFDARQVRIAHSEPVEREIQRRRERAS
jgi:hypothetical protein